MHRVDNLFEQIVSDENLLTAIIEVNKSHRWMTHHRPNRCVAWIEETFDERVRELRQIITDGFVQTKPKCKQRYDPSAQKWRDINEPLLWPDQYVHHALIQVLKPIFMRGMDKYCCGSIEGRGTHYGKAAIERWMRHDPAGTKYCEELDIRHFYDSLQPSVVMARMRSLIKDARVLDLIWRIVKDGVLIGSYCSQWFANVVLQPLDQIIRQSGLCKYYVRYMDNFTIKGPNKRKLHQLRHVIEDWLRVHRLTLKGNWQVFSTRLKVKRRSDGTVMVRRSKRKNPCRPRLPSALGYRYGHSFTLLRKHNLIRLKRYVNRFRKRRRQGRRVQAGNAAGLLSRFGQLKHCNNYEIYRRILRGEKIQRQLKSIIRQSNRRELLTWSTFLEQRARWKSSRSRVQAAPT